MSASISSFIVCAQKWKKTLPPDLLAACEKIENEEDWENPQYEKIMMEELYPSKWFLDLEPYSTFSVVRYFRAHVTISQNGYQAEAAVEAKFMSTLCSLHSRALCLSPSLVAVSANLCHLILTMAPQASRLRCKELNCQTHSVHLVESLPFHWQEETRHENNTPGVFY